MARRIPVVAAEPAEDVYKIALTQPSGYANLSPGPGTWRWINPWWAGAMGDIQYTTPVSYTHLTLPTKA